MEHSLDLTRGGYVVWSNAWLRACSGTKTGAKQCRNLHIFPTRLDHMKENLLASTLNQIGGTAFSVTSGLCGFAEVSLILLLRNRLVNWLVG